MLCTEIQNVTRSAEGIRDGRIQRFGFKQAWGNLPLTCLIGRALFIPYVVAGFPFLDNMHEQLLALEEKGAGIIELG